MLKFYLREYAGRKLLVRSNISYKYKHSPEAFYVFDNEIL